MPSLALNCLRTFAILCTVVVLSSLAYSGENDGDPSTSLSLRIRYDSTGCPAAAQVYLDQTADTLAGFEITLMWDQPGIVYFKRVQMDIPILDENSLSNPKPVLAPEIHRDNDILRHWDYVEARGDSGHWVKVTGMSSLMASADSLLIVPGDQGVLFELTLVTVASDDQPMVGDSLGLHIQGGALRLSNNRGQLAQNIYVQDVILPIQPCRGEGNSR